MKWNPSFESYVRPDGERAHRIGHQLIDEFLEFVVAGPVRTRCGPMPMT